MWQGEHKKGGLFKDKDQVKDREQEHYNAVNKARERRQALDG